MKKYNRIFVIVLDSLGIGATVAENFDVKCRKEPSVIPFLKDWDKNKQKKEKNKG